MADYNGWANWATWNVNLLLNGDYGSDRDEVWEDLVREAARIGPDALKALVIDEVVIPTIESSTAPEAARLFVLSLVGDSSLDEVDWQELADHHQGDDIDVGKCLHCGDPIDYCLDHKSALPIIEAHDDGNHSQCHPEACEESTRDQEEPQQAPGQEELFA